MNLEKIIEKIEEKTENGARYKRTRGKQGEQIRDKGRRARLGDSVVARYYQRDTGETVYEVFERHRLVFGLIRTDDTDKFLKPVKGRWIKKLDLEETDVYEPQKTAEEKRLEELGAKLIEKAYCLAMNGQHIDETRDEARHIGRLYQKDDLRVVMWRQEKNGESSPRTLNIVYGKDMVFMAVLTNDNKEVSYFGELTWTEDFLRIK